MMDHPETEVIEGGEESFIHINRIAPVYPLTEGLPQRWLRGLIWRTLEKFERRHRASRHVTFRRIDCRPMKIAALCTRRGTLLSTRANAVHMMHFPEELTDVEIARRRLALDEFVELQVQIRSRRKKFEANRKALPCGGDNRLMKPFLARLGFKLTGAQTKVLREIRADMRPARIRCGGCCRRCRLGQNRRGRVHGVDGAGKRLQRRADGADGDSGGATFPKFSQMV